MKPAGLSPGMHSIRECNHPTIPAYRLKSGLFPVTDSKQKRKPERDALSCDRLDERIINPREIQFRA